MKMKVMLVLLLVLVLLAGCGKKTEEPSAPAEPAAPAAPVEEAVSGLYFANRADNHFLYELNPDTMEAVPFVEKQIYNPVYHDGNVYYLNSDLQQVICMDAATGAEVVAAENVGWVYYSAAVEDAENPDNSKLEIRAYSCEKDKIEVARPLPAPYSDQ